MSDIIIPKYSSRVDREFFARDAKMVAIDLLGKVLIVQHPNDIYYARLCEVAAYEGKTKTTAKTATYYPGTVGISRKFGKNLLDISTGKLPQYSCVTLVSAFVENGEDSKLIEGPGNLTDALGIDYRYDGVMIDCSPQLWIGGETIDADEIRVRKRSNLPKNCRGYFYFR